MMIREQWGKAWCPKPVDIFHEYIVIIFGGNLWRINSYVDSVVGYYVWRVSVAIAYLLLASSFDAWNLPH